MSWRCKVKSCFYHHHHRTWSDWLAYNSSPIGWHPYPVVLNPQLIGSVIQAKNNQLISSMLLCNFFFKLPSTNQSTFLKTAKVLITTCRKSSFRRGRRRQRVASWFFPLRSQHAAICCKVLPRITVGGRVGVMFLSALLKITGTVTRAAMEKTLNTRVSARSIFFFMSVFFYILTLLCLCSFFFMTVTCLLLQLQSWQPLGALSQAKFRSRSAWLCTKPRVVLICVAIQ